MARSVLVFASCLCLVSGNCAAQVPIGLSPSVGGESSSVEVVIDLDLAPSQQAVDIKDVFVRKPNRQLLLVRNTTKSLLRPREVSVSCGCVTAKMEEKGVAPGEFLKIELEVNLSKDIDKLLQTLSIVFEESEIGRKDFVLKANVHSDISIQPRTLRFSSSDEVHLITLTSDPSVYRLKGVVAESGNVLIESIAETSAGVFELRVRSGIAAGQATELLRSKLVLVSDGSEIVRDFVVGLSGARRCTFLPSVLDPSVMVDGKESRVLLIFPGAYTPPENAEPTISLVGTSDESMSLPLEHCRTERRSARVCEIYIKNISKLVKECSSVKVCYENECFFLPLASVEK